MGLREYRRKRDFSRTPEPSGEAAPAATGTQPLYVIQKHAARRTHYDFRLEMDGVLKSWAVPKGPSLDPQQKRLAVEVEDHPLDYGGFEGVIPKGEYGGGTVMIWDRGWWEPVGEAAKGFAKGDFKFVLHGAKLQGRFVLVRMARREGEKATNWLLIKERDATAIPGSDTAVVDELADSIATGRDMARIAKEADRVWRSGSGEVTAPARPDPAAIAGAVKAASLPQAAPQLATLAEHPPPGDDWLHEIKFNGYRMLAYIERGKARLMSRADLDWSKKFPELVQALAALPVKNAILDGEVVHVAPSGVTSFGALQNALAEGKTAGLVYMAFDLLHLDGFDLRGAKLVDRKAALKALLPADAPAIRYSDHQLGRGRDFFGSASRFGLEGIVSKRPESRYRSGRGTNWLKIKCGASDEFVVAGYTDPAGERAGFGALLLGYFTPQKKLVYAGKVGTGFSDKTLETLGRALSGLERKKPTVALPEEVSPDDVHWVEPKLVAEVRYGEWTIDGVLRHSSFIGLREDKAPEEVVLDPASAARRDAAADAPPAPAIARDGSAVVDGVRVTHAARVVYPALGLTKLDVARYYAAVAPLMLPHIAKRPLSLLRCPDGVDGESFFQKHLVGAGPAVKQVPIRGSDGKIDQHVMIEDAKGLLSLVQMGVLEFHPWGSTAAAVEKPDRLIFDLDPDESLSWSRVVAAALAIREALAALGLKSFAKTTGGKGLHLVVPVKPVLAWPEAGEFTRAFVAKLAAAEPALYTSAMGKAQRRGRIFIDFLRNRRGATAVAAFSTRARPPATVSAPLSWAEVESGIRSDQFTVVNLPQRLHSLETDPWADFFATRQSLEAAAKQL
jgi:bifunctional non-homologous end joining protein LigD